MDPQEQFVPLVKSMNVGKERKDPQVPGYLELTETDVAGCYSNAYGEKSPTIKDIKQINVEILDHAYIIDEGSGKEKSINSS